MIIKDNKNQVINLLTIMAIQEDIHKYVNIKLLLMTVDEIKTKLIRRKIVKLRNFFNECQIKKEDCNECHHFIFRLTR